MTTKLQLFPFLLVLLVVVVLSSLTDAWSHGEVIKPVRKCKRDGSCSLVDNPNYTNLPKDIENGRLPTALNPYLHNVELTPDIYNGAPFPLTGVNEIYVTCDEATDVIYLNMNGQLIDPDSIELTVAEDSPVQPDPPEWTEFQVDDNLEFFILSLDRLLTVGANYRLNMRFSTQMRTPEQSGFYWLSYTEDDETKYMAASQFATHDARSAFPCFDEPGFKLSYGVTLVRMEEMTALSAMPVDYQEDRGDGWIADVFEPSPPMAAYFLMFAVCEFEYVEEITPGGHVTRVWARRDMIQYADVPLAAAVQFIDWFDDYLGVRYPLPKLDHIGIPSEALFAMENWGLIAYPEGRFLKDPDYSTTEQMEEIPTLVSHEIAHLWFGDLVTCQWWDHTWLNEGFARAFQNGPLLDSIGWDGDDMNMLTYQDIMRFDNSNTSSPVRIEVETPWDSWDSFSRYAYNKGSCVVRMLKQIVGDNTFQRAINRYLVEHYFGSVTTDDLWRAFTEQAAEDGITDTDGSALDIKEKMDPWVEQNGHPVVTMHRETGGVANVYQHRFLSPPDQEVNEPSPWGHLWNVPISFHTGEDPSQDKTTKIWMDRENTTIVDGIPDSTDEWLVANVGCTGFFRMDYDIDNRRAIVQQLLQQHDVIHRASRSQFIYDTFTMVEADYYGEVEGFETTSYLHNEQDFLPWNNADYYLYYPSLMLARFQDTFTYHVSYMRSLVDPLYEYVGWDHDLEDSYELRRLRGIGLRLACGFNNPDCLDGANDLFDQWKEDEENNPVHVDHRLTVYCSAIRSGDADNWDFAHSAYLQTAASSHHYADTEVNTLLAALACSEDEDTLNKYLSYTFDPELILPNDASWALTSLAEADYGGRWVMWQHLKDNWRNDPVPEGVNQNDILLSVVDGFASDEDLQELEDFIELYPAEDPEEVTTYDQALQRVEDNNQWAATNVDDLDSWLQEHAPADTSGYVTSGGILRAGHVMSHILREMREETEGRVQKFGQ